MWSYLSNFRVFSFLAMMMIIMIMIIIVALYVSAGVISQLIKNH